MLKQTYTCDVCGAERKEGNHWFSVLFTSGGAHLRKWQERGDSDYHLCGQECVHKMLDKWMIRPTPAPTPKEEPEPAHQTDVA